MSPCPLSGSLLVIETRLKPADPDSESFTPTETLTGTNWLFGGQRMFGLALHATVGGVLSSLIVSVFAASMLPALSVPKKLIVVTPSVVIWNEARLPLAIVEATG
jgi:hypothetical protein